MGNVTVDAAKEFLVRSANLNHREAGTPRARQERIDAECQFGLQPREESLPSPRQR